MDQVTLRLSCDVLGDTVGDAAWVAKETKIWLWMKLVVVPILI